MNISAKNKYKINIGNVGTLIFINNSEECTY